MLEKTLESPLDRNEIKPVNPKGNQPWIFIGKTNAEAEASILWPPAAKSRLIGKRPWCWERLRAGREEDDSRWAGWMASLMQRTSWVWANSGRLWRTGKPGVMQSMGSQRVRHELATEQQQHAFWISVSGPVNREEKTIKRFSQPFQGNLSFHYFPENFSIFLVNLLLIHCTYVWVLFLVQNISVHKTEDVPSSGDLFWRGCRPQTIRLLFSCSVLSNSLPPLGL